MRKKAKKLFSSMAAVIAAFTLLGSTAMAATANNVNILQGAGGAYLKNSGMDYRFRVDELGDLFRGILINGIEVPTDQIKVNNILYSDLIKPVSGASTPAAATTTAAPATSEVPATTEAPTATTEAPATTVAPPEESTVAPPEESTVAPPEPTTVAPPEPTTVAPPEPTTVAPPEPTTVNPPEPTTVNPPEPTPDTSPEPGPVVTPEPTPEASPEPGPVVTPEPTPEASPEPTPEASSGIEYPVATGYSMGQAAQGKNIFQTLLSFLAPVKVQAEETYSDIAISASYLDTLSDGVYTVALNYTSGQAVTTITVTSDPAVAAKANPSTGDNTNIVPYVVLAASSAVILVFLGKKKKEETK